MVRGLNVQQLEEVAMQEEAWASDAIARVRDLAWRQREAGKLTGNAVYEVLKALAMVEIAMDETRTSPVVGQADVADVVSSNIATEWACSF